MSLASRKRLFQLGFQLPDPLREVDDEVLPAVGAHAGAEDFPALPGKLHVMVPCGRASEAAFGAADADVAPTHVDDLHWGGAVWTGMKRHRATHS